jgi:hypothetical protein
MQDAGWFVILFLSFPDTPDQRAFMSIPRSFCARFGFCYSMYCQKAATRGFMLCLVTSLLIPNPLVAQTDQSPSNLGWLTLGLGVGAGRGGASVALGAEASFQRGAHLFSGRVLSSGELFEPWTQADEAAVLYGRTHNGRRHQAAFSVGPSVLRCQKWSKCGDPDMPDPFANGSFKTRVGLALSGQTFWTPLRFFGIGLYGFANINGSGILGGAMLALRFGKLR